MAKDTWMISESQLKEWHDLLDGEPSVPGDGISTVKEQISDVLIQLRQFNNSNEVKEEVLTLDDLIIGELYRLKNETRIKPSLRGAVFKVLEKKLKYATGELQSGKSKRQVGKLYNLTPSNLEKV